MHCSSHINRIIISNRTIINYFDKKHLIFNILLTKQLID